MILSTLVKNPHHQKFQQTFRTSYQKVIIKPMNLLSNPLLGGCRGTPSGLRLSLLRGRGRHPWYGHKGQDGSRDPRPLGRDPREGTRRG